jgi:hypothetical protein
MTKATESTSELREAVLKAWQNLRRLRSAARDQGVEAGGDLSQAERAYEQLCRDYATYRIVKGLGPDPEVLDGETFESVLASFSNPGRRAKTTDTPCPSNLARETMTRMLSCGIGIADVLGAADQASESQEAFNPFTELRQALRRWADHTLGDPYIDRCLESAAAHTAEFNKAVDDARQLLNRMRAKYEETRNGADELIIQRNSHGKLQLSAVFEWDAMARMFPDDANEVYACVAVADLAARKIDHLADSLNRNLALFFSELIPRYLKLLRKLPVERRKELTGGVRPTSALAARLVATATATDFAVDTATRMGFGRRKLPKPLRLFSTQTGYERVRDLIAGRKTQDASTVVVRHGASETSHPE